MRSYTLALAGDVMLGRLVARAIAERGFAYPWGRVLPLLQQFDLFLINLECALTNHTDPWHNGQPKAFYFRAPPSAIQTLRIGRVDFACVANNHIGDFGTPGLIETLQCLDQAGIAHAGAGTALEAARAPAYLRRDDLRVAVVAFADHPREWAAGPTTPGINFTPISTAPEVFSAVAEVITAARQAADLVIFTIHWGPNMRPRPTPAFREFARQVMAAGADIFWGHSAHVVQGIEVWEGKPILYDTGDFVDDYVVDAALRNDLSFLFVAHLQPPTITHLELFPMQIADLQVNPAPPTARTRLFREMATRCAEMGTRLVVQSDRLTLPIAQDGRPSV